MPVGCARAYSVSSGASAVPLASSAPCSSMAAGDCMAKAGRDREAMNPAKGWFRVTVAVPSSVASQDL